MSCFILLYENTYEGPFFGELCGIREVVQRLTERNTIPEYNFRIRT